MGFVKRSSNIALPGSGEDCIEGQRLVVKAIVLGGRGCEVEGEGSEELEGSYMHD